MKVYRLTIKVRPNSKKEELEKISDSQYYARVRPQAKEGRANEAVKELLSDYFGLPKSRISIVKGLKSRFKAVQIIKP